MSGDENSKDKKPTKLPTPLKKERSPMEIVGGSSLAPSTPPSDPSPVPQEEDSDEFWEDEARQPFEEDRDEDSDESEYSVERRRVRKKKTPPPTQAFFKGLPGLRVPLLPTLLVLLLPLVLISWLFYNLGVAEGEQLSEEAATKEGTQLPPEVSTALNQALLKLRDGDSAEAVKRLEAVENEPINYPSVTYLVALAAMQDGNIDLSEQKVNASIAKRERISDALALQAVLETQKGQDPTRIKIADPRKKSEDLLRQAIVADAANPYPHFELATLLRYRGEREEALKEVYAAKARLNPIDSHTIMDITSSIMELEAVPVDQLPTATPDSDDIRNLFPAAYSAMRRGDFASAAALLRKSRRLVSPDIFDYAVNDPAIRKYAREPALAEFYQTAP